MTFKRITPRFSAVGLVETWVPPLLSAVLPCLLQVQWGRVRARNQCLQSFLACRCNANRCSFLLSPNLLRMEVPYQTAPESRTFLPCLCNPIDLGHAPGHVSLRPPDFRTNQRRDRTGVG